MDKASNSAVTDFDVNQLSWAEQQKILEIAALKFGADLFFDSLEDLLSSPDGFGLTTMTPLQRAVCRIIDGVEVGELWKARRPKGYEHVAEDFAAGQPLVTDMLSIASPDDYKVRGKPAEVLWLAAVRSAKSLFAAGVAIWATQKCDLSHLRDGEIARYSILSLSMDNARVVLGHLNGVLNKPRLKSLLVDTRQLDETGGDDVSGSLFLSHPSSHIVEIRVVAGRRAGGSLVSRWSIGACLDEAPRMVGASEGVINYDDARRAVRSRLLPGAQILSIGSPWQPFGPVYDIVQSEEGDPTNDRVVLRAKGPDLNPYWWTADRCIELRDSRDTNSKITFATDVLAKFADEKQQLFPQVTLAHCTRDFPLVIDYVRGHDYRAAIDPATRGNAWTFVVVGRFGRMKKVCFAKEWRGSPVDPLSPREVIREIAHICQQYKLDHAFTDQWAADHNRDMALEEGFAMVDVSWNLKETADAYTSMASAMADGTIELPPNAQMLKDLKQLRKRPTNKGYSIHLPSTPDGRHCDYAPALIRGLKPWLDEEVWIAPRPGEDGYTQFIADEMERADEEAFARSNQQSDDSGLWDVDDEWETQNLEDDNDMMIAARQLSSEF